MCGIIGCIEPGVQAKSLTQILIYICKNQIDTNITVQITVRET